MKTYFVAVLLCIWLWLEEGSALSCYQCDSKTNPDCKEEFDIANQDALTVRSTECSVDAATYCIKTTGVWGGVVGTTRSCSSRDMGNQCQFIRYPDHDRIYRACIYTCRGNHCNGAEKTVAVSVLGVTVSIFLMLYNLTR